MLSIYFLSIIMQIGLSRPAEDGSITIQGKTNALPVDALSIIASCLRYKDFESFNQVSKSYRAGAKICYKANAVLIEELQAMYQASSSDINKIREIAGTLINRGDQQYFITLLRMVCKTGYDRPEYTRVLNALNLFPNHQTLLVQQILHERTFENASDELVLLTIASHYLPRGLFRYNEYVHRGDPILTRLMGLNYEQSSYRFLFERPFTPQRPDQIHPFNSLRHHKRWYFTFAILYEYLISHYLNASADMQHRMVAEWHFLPWDSVMIKWHKCRYVEKVWDPIYPDPQASRASLCDMNDEVVPGRSEIVEHIQSAVNVFQEILQRIKLSQFHDVKNNWFTVTKIRMEKFWVKWFMDLTSSIRDKSGSDTSMFHHDCDIQYVLITVALANYLRGNTAEYHQMLELLADPIYTPSFGSQKKLIGGYQVGFRGRYYGVLEEQLNVGPIKVEVSWDDPPQFERTDVWFKEQSVEYLLTLHRLGLSS